MQLAAISPVPDCWNAGRDASRVELADVYGDRLVASLYTDDRAPARLLGGTTLRIAQRIAPFRPLIAGHLTQAR